MYLKEIKSQGFKSFADKINIELNKGITGIVGPNGSGKSNVVDAIRWVLGEQSVKSLRGSLNMQDVIFQGSKSRNPMNIASVSLVFDNSDKYLNLPFNEISVKRRLYKDGTNEYYINDDKVRLKDIIDLFMDSGIGKDSFNIISQGKIDEILSNKLDRRIVFEEAAGVSKYKKRKEEALKKVEKTNVNLDRVNDIVKELETQIEPLKEQKEKALKYKELTKELEEVEVALVVDDITNLNYSYKDKKQIIENTKNEILQLQTSSSNNLAIVEDYKLKISNIENEIQELNKKIIETTTLKEQINGQKNIIAERRKYQVDDIKLHENIVNLKEEKLKKENEINKINIDINNINKDILELQNKLNHKVSILDNINKDKISYEKKLQELNIKETLIKSDINSLENLIENSSSIPTSVKRAIDNPKLTGIHNIIGNLIDTSLEYSLAISTSLGASANFVVVDNESNAKEAIEYLKQNKLGRTTFFPLNIIKPKYIDNNLLNIIKNSQGFINLASNLVSYDNKYQNIILNQLGNIIIVDTIDNANALAKKINYTLRIVTKEGEMINQGGSITGGLSKTRNIITDKHDLDIKNKELEKLTNDIKEIEVNLNIINDKLRKTDDEIYLIKQDLIEQQTILSNKNNILVNTKNEYNKINEEINGTTNIINNTLSKEEDNIINKYYEISKQLDNLYATMNEKNKNKTNLTDSLNDFEFSIRKDNNLFINKNETLKNLEIEVNRIDVKLDNLLNTLNETYSITYEKASSLYKLEIDEKTARTKVNNLKRMIKELGNVNLLAIEEYDKIKQRYEFLLTQRDDLVNAINTLNDIIKQMDEIMIKEFSKTFKEIKENFKITFRELFNGGNADLILTDTSNLLESGIDIVACPPGKSLKNINALSGGEKTFTAISLLFAILKTRTMPFCLLDEVEAALDEANVDAFGKYITKLKDKTQFILITHKKKTMEYADYLYGITMQESGVSKLVSVKLEEI